MDTSNSGRGRERSCKHLPDQLLVAAHDFSSMMKAIQKVIELHLLQFYRVEVKVLPPEADAAPRTRSVLRRFSHFTKLHARVSIHLCCCLCFASTRDSEQYQGVRTDHLAHLTWHWLMQSVLSESAVRQIWSCNACLLPLG